MGLHHGSLLVRAYWGAFRAIWLLPPRSAERAGEPVWSVEWVFNGTKSLHGLQGSPRKRSGSSAQGGVLLLLTHHFQETLLVAEHRLAQPAIAQFWYEFEATCAALPPEPCEKAERTSWQQNFFRNSFSRSQRQHFRTSTTWRIKQSQKSTSTTRTSTSWR